MSKAQVSLARTQASSSLPKAKGPEPVGIPHADQALVGKHQQGIGAPDLAQGLDEALDEGVAAGAGQQMDDDLGIDRGNENGSPGLQLVPDAAGVDQVAVMGEGDGAPGILDGDGLGVSNWEEPVVEYRTWPMALGPGKCLKSVLVKNIGDQAHALVVEKLAVFHGADAGRFLAPVLEGMEA